MSCVVWRATPHEAEAVAGLMIAFRDHLGRDWPSDNAFLAGVETLLEDPHTDFLLGSVDADSPPQGVIQLRYQHTLWVAGLSCLLEDLYVAPGARGSGLGRALVAGGREQAVARRARRMELDCNEANTTALALYSSFGFDAKNLEKYGGRDLMLAIELPRDQPAS